jgi:hypothetical protein
MIFAIKYSNGKKNHANFLSQGHKRAPYFLRKYWKNVSLEKKLLTIS